MSNIETLIKGIEKSYGKGSIMTLETRREWNIDFISTGSLAIDHALGTGGVPKGRVIEIYGPESSGKTTLALHIIAEAQKLGDLAAIIDMEHALDPEYAEKLGVVKERLLISQPDYGEQALEIVEECVKSGEVGVVVIDSVAALAPKAEIEGHAGDSHMGLQARLLNQSMRKLAPLAAKHNCCVIFINQVRDKIGIVFGNPETTTGGKGLRFTATQRIEIRKSSQLKNGEIIIGNAANVKVVKNKLGPPGRKASVEIIYGKGFNRLGEIVDFACDFGIINKSGAWYSYKDEKIGQGKEKTIAFLKDNEKICAEVESAVMEILNDR